MVGEDLSNAFAKDHASELYQVEELIKLARKYDLQQLSVRNIVIVPRPEVPKVDLEALAKKLQAETKITDEDLLMNPYAGMNNLPRGE